jgi:phage tail-like protein
MEVGKTPARSIGSDPYAAFRFNVEIDGLVVSGFSEATGLTFETEVVTIREGGENAHEWQLAGPTKFPSRLLLKRGLADADALWSWYRDIMDGSIVRKRVTVLLMNHAGEESWRWAFRDACPVKWVGPELRAGTAAIAFESIELVHKGLDPGSYSGRQLFGFWRDLLR